MENIITRSGLIYRNPRPHVISRHAYFPSVIYMDNGEMLASMAIGEAFEAVNLNTYICRSTDMGETWSNPVPLFGKQNGLLTSNFSRITSTPDGNVVANVVRSYRDMHPDEGLANPVNIGMVPTDLLVVRSKDWGNSWEPEELISPPLIGPSFEQCCPILPLRDGRWLWPTSTWRGWDGYCSNGMKMVALVSHDKGKTWPDYMSVMDRNEDKIIYWESKIIELKNGLLVAIAWTYDEKNGKDLPNHYTISRDGGKSWQVPVSINIHGETMAITELPDGRLIMVYRRMDKPGLWSTVSHLKNNEWINEKDYSLWGAQESGLTNKSDNMVQDFNELKFGAPCITLLPDNLVYVAFWCYEKMVSNIRWFKLRIM
jgi:sialidase-1